MKIFNRENWLAAKERLAYFLQELDAEGYPPDLVADVTMLSGVYLIDKVYGRDVLLGHLSRLALRAADPNADLSNGSFTEAAPALKRSVMCELVPSTPHTTFTFFSPQETRMSEVSFNRGSTRLLLTQEEGVSLLSILREYNHNSEAST